MNIVILVGHVGADPERRKAGDHKVASFSIAVHRGKDKKPMWVYIEAWNDVAEAVATHVKKGMKITILGDLTHSEWTAEDGTKRDRYYVTARKVQWAAATSTKDEGDAW